MKLLVFARYFRKMCDKDKQFQQIGILTEHTSDETHFDIFSR